MTRLYNFNRCLPIAAVIIGKARIRRLEIDELVVGTLSVKEESANWEG
jgi:hypothetical protein